jgi:hypothetical protein
MHHAIVAGWMPWLGLLVAAGVVLLLLARLSGARLEVGRLARIHRDQDGAVQSLSFVLTLPLFVMVMMFIVQVSQLMIAMVVVQYAAYAAARAAIVWIPAHVANTVTGIEAQNCIGPSVSAGDATSSPTTMTSSGDLPPGTGMSAPLVAESFKLAHIALAAKWACVPISPSRSLGLTPNPGIDTIAEIAYRAFARNSTIPSAAISRRLQNKVAYAFAEHQPLSLYNRTTGAWLAVPDSQTTSVAVQHYQRDPTQTNEVGWQDPLTATVTHYLVLLPGPGNMLFRYVSLGASQGMGNNFGYLITPSGRVPVFRIVAEATLLNEGQKSVVPYVYQPL